MAAIATTAMAPIITIRRVMMAGACGFGSVAVVMWVGLGRDLCGEAAVVENERQKTPARSIRSEPARGHRLGGWRSESTRGSEAWGVAMNAMAPAATIVHQQLP